jgi:hypothetical protein
LGPIKCALASTAAKLQTAIVRCKTTNAGARGLSVEVDLSSCGDVQATVILGCVVTMLLVGQRRCVHTKALAIEKALGMVSFDPRWTLPGLPERTPLVWMAEANGLPVDLRDMSRDVQEIAFRRRIESL